MAEIERGRGPAPTEGEIDFMALFSALMTQKALILSIVLCSWVLGLIYVNLATPIYRADTLIHIERKSSALPGLEHLNSAFGAQTQATAEMELLRSRSVLRKTVDDLRLDIIASPIYFPYVGEAVARRFRPTFRRPVAGAWLGFDRYAWGGEKITVAGLAVDGPYKGRPLMLRALEDDRFQLFVAGELVIEAAVGELAVDNSANIRILVSELLARPGTEFSIHKIDKLAATRRLQSKLHVKEKGARTGLLLATIDDADRGWAERVLDHIAQEYVLQNVRSKSSEAEKSIKFLQDQLPVVKRELEQAENQLNAYRIDSRLVDINIETQAVLSQVVDVEKEISSLQFKRAELAQQFKPEHPVFATLELQMHHLETKKSNLEAKVNSLPDSQQKMLSLFRTVEVKTAIYTQLLNKAQELEVLRAGTVGNVRVVDTAISVGPISPRRGRIMLLSVMAGLAVGLGLAIVRILLRRGVESPEQIEKLGIPVYASVPFSQEQLGTQKAKKLLARDKPEDLAIEALRGLRTSLHFALVGADRRLVMVTGPSPNIGKTFVSSNLAALVAQAGERVLIVDADLRRGTLHQYFNAQVDGGLSEYMAGRADLETVIRDAGDGLSYISRGKSPPNPAELLMSEKFTALLDELCSRFDLVIVDTPPVLAVTDAAIVGSQVAATLLIARFAENQPAEIEHAKERLEQNGVAVKGAVLNGVQRSIGTYSYGYSYYQYEYKSDK